MCWRKLYIDYIIIGKSSICILKEVIHILYLKYMIKRELYYKRESSMIHLNCAYIKELEGWKNPPLNEATLMSPHSTTQWRTYHILFYSTLIM